MLPPDNFQDDPRPAIAHRTSPTNIGLYLLSAVSARDFGWTGTLETIERLEATFDTLKKMQRLKGHFFNWYATEDLRTLDPPYVSSVDSGNFAGHLIALANACEEWVGAHVAGEARTGILDTLMMARQSLEPGSGEGERGRQLLAMLDDIETHLRGNQSIDAVTPTLKRLTAKAAKVAREGVAAREADGEDDVAFWLEALAKAVAEHDRDRSQTSCRRGRRRHATEGPGCLGP